MADLKPLYEFIGDPVLMLGGTTHASAAIAASDNLAGVPILGADGVLFIEFWGATDTSAAHQLQIQYSSTGNASDAVTSNAGMTCTDAVGSTNPQASVGVKLIDLSVSAKGMADAAGKFYVSMGAAETGAVNFGLIGIPYGGSRLYPATNANTVIRAESRS